MKEAFKNCMQRIFAPKEGYFGDAVKITRHSKINKKLKN